MIALLIISLIILAVAGVVWFFMRVWAPIMTVVTALGAALLLVFFIVLAASSGGSGKTSASNQPSPSPSASSLNFTYTQLPAKDCDGGYNVVEDPNIGNRVVSTGVPGTAQKSVDTVMKIAQHDPRVLYLYYNAAPMGQNKPLKTVTELVDPKAHNGCYSEEGRLIYGETLGAYESAVKAVGQAPAVGINTGIYNHGSPFQEPAGPITGNRTATLVTFKNGQQMAILHRCGNVVVKKPIPHIPTPQPKPKPKPHPHPTPTPTPTPTCKGPSNEVSVVNGQCVKHCPKAGGCGPNGQNAPPVQQDNPGGTKGYGGGGCDAECVSGHQTPPADPYSPDPTYGSHPSPGQSAPPGAGNPSDPPGGSSGTGAPQGSPNPGGGTAQPGNPCEDPNAPGCGP